MTLWHYYYADENELCELLWSVSLRWQVPYSYIIWAILLVTLLKKDKEVDKVNTMTFLRCHFVLELFKMKIIGF